MINLQKSSTIKLFRAGMLSALAGVLAASAGPASAEPRTVDLVTGSFGNVEAQFQKATPDGNTVFFTTAEQIPGKGDTDTAVDLYKASGGQFTLLSNAGANTGGGQFFIVTADACPWLDGKHTVFGRVTSGIEVADAISELPSDSADKPREDAVIERVEIRDGSPG